MKDMVNERENSRFGQYDLEGFEWLMNKYVMIYD